MQTRLKLLNIKVVSLEMQIMAGQMCWLAGLGESAKILHLREQPHQPWKPYTAFAQYQVPDLKIRGASKGWTTYQRLRAAGWTLIATDAAYLKMPAITQTKL
ncbi:MAG TPA: hypothetical protein VL134_14245 [Leptolyngbya sp.]|jgi:hypothetical protein|nr:hypothetical protein [Leptolyngbya sp.]